MAVVVAIGHGVADRRAPEAADHSADRTADRRPADRARDTSGERAAFGGPEQTQAPR